MKRIFMMFAIILATVATVGAGEGTPPVRDTPTHAGKSKGLDGTALARTAATARATPGTMVRFAEGDLPDSITDNIPVRCWGEWCDRFFYSDATGTAQTIAKGVSGEPMSHAEYVPLAGGGAGAWVQIGPDDLITPKGDATDPDDLIMPGGSEYGHPFETHCLDLTTGDYYFGNYGKVFCYRNNYAERATKPWSYRTSGNGTTNHFMDDGARGGLAFHPDLFGTGDSGLVATSVGKFFAWRKSTDQWVSPLSLTGGTGKPAPIKAFQLLYAAGLKTVYGGGEEGLFIKVVPGNPPTVTKLGGTPKGTDGAPLQIYGGHSFGPVRASLLDDPEKKALYLYQRSARSASKPHIWKLDAKAEGSEKQWIDLGEHPFGSGPSGEKDLPYLTATVYGQGVIWVMCGTGVGRKMNSYLYCPPK